MAKVGLPYLTLDRQDHFGDKNKHSGNARAVILEGLEERQSSDPDLDRTKTANNIYYGERSGEALLKKLETDASEYIITDKKGRQRHLRSNANIGFACICKPESSYIDNMTPEEQKRFFDDSYEVMKNMFESHGLVVDAAVIQFDERSPHMHMYGHDPEYNLGRKFNLKMRSDMNRDYYPAEMRKRGWSVDDLPKNYDAEYAKTLTDDELKDYKATCRAKRKEHGKSAKTYKADKDAAKIKAGAEKQAKQITAQAEQQARQITAQAKQQAERIKADAKNQAVQIVTDAKFDALQTKMDNQQKTAELSKREQVNAEKERANAEKEKQLRADAVRQEFEQEKLDARESALDAREASIDEEVESYKAELKNTANEAVAQFKGQLTEQYAEKYENMKEKLMQTYQFNADKLKEREKALDVLSRYADEYTVNEIARQQAGKRHTSPMTERERINRSKRILQGGYTWIDEPQNNGSGNNGMSF